MSIDLKSICRLCMIHSKSMAQLFDDNSYLPKTIMKLMPTLKISTEDKLPRQVCEDCVSHVNNFDRFKLKCENSDLILNEYVRNLQLVNEKMENSETWRATPTDTPCSGKVCRNKEVEGCCKKEDEEETVYFQMKDEDIEDYKYDAVKEEPEIQHTIMDGSDVTNVPSVNETVSNSNGTKSSKPYRLPCQICGKMVVRKRFSVHIKRHTVGRPYKCGDCGKAYSDRRSLKTHSVIHSGLKIFMCDICGKTFKLSTHLKNHHLTHTGQKSFVCIVCGKGFSQIGNLKKHEMIHTGERPFKCDICSKCFSGKSSLQIHLAVHSGQREHSCKICGKGFLLKVHLRNHMVVHSGEKRFSCEVCGSKYAQRSSLKKHKSKHNIQK